MLLRAGRRRWRSAPALRALSTQALGLSHMPRFEMEKLDGWDHATHHLASSDCEPLRLAELLALADADGLERWERLSLGYPNTQGELALREEIAWGLYEGALQPRQVLGVVPAEGILLAMHAMLRPGDHVVVTTPAYASLQIIASDALGCAVSPWAAEWGADGEPSFPLSALRDALRPETRAVVVNFPHNPTGFVPTRGEWDELVGLCEERDIYLFSVSPTPSSLCPNVRFGLTRGAAAGRQDEMYRHLERPGSRPTLPAAVECYAKAVTLSGLSKAYGLPGLRVGWLASRDEAVLQRAFELKVKERCPPNGFVQMI